MMNDLSKFNERLRNLDERLKSYETLWEIITRHLDTQLEVIMKDIEVTSDKNELVIEMQNKIKKSYMKINMSFLELSEKFNSISNH